MLGGALAAYNDTQKGQTFISALDVVIVFVLNLIFVILEAKLPSSTPNTI